MKRKRNGVTQRVYSRPKEHSHKLVVHTYNERLGRYVTRNIKPREFGSSALECNIFGRKPVILEACYTYPISRETHLYVERWTRRK